MDRPFGADVALTIVCAFGVVFTILICACLFGLKRPENKLFLLGFFSLIASGIFSVVFGHGGPTLAANLVTGGMPGILQRVGCLLILGGIALVLMPPRSPAPSATPGGNNTHAS